MNVVLVICVKLFVIQIASAALVRFVKTDFVFRDVEAIHFVQITMRVLINSVEILVRVLQHAVPVLLVELLIMGFNAAARLD